MSLLIQAHVAQAAHDVIAVWPIGSFIALNPLAAHESTRFENIHEPGITLTQTLPRYRAQYASGRITRPDLISALHERIGELDGFPVLELGRMAWSAAEILVEEMLRSDSRPPTPRTLSAADPLEQHVTKWVAAFVDPDAQWPIPGRRDGFYSAWHALSVHDPHLSRLARRRIRSLPDQALPALTAALTHLGVADGATVQTLTAELAALPGWTSYLKWRSEHSGDIDLTEYLAVRLALRHALDLPPRPLSPRPGPDGDHPPDPAKELWARAEQISATLSPSPTRAEVAMVARVLILHPPTDHPFTWQAAYESHYRTALVQSITYGTAAPGRPTVQVVMCIDPRSEGVRRHLESHPGLETLGFAGFFGVPVRFTSFQGRGAVDSLPALLRPRHAVTESPTSPQRAHRRSRGLRFLDAAAHALHATENATATPFALAETAGWFYGATTFTRTLAPGLHHTLTRTWRTLIAPPSPSEVTVSDAFSLEERVTLAEAAVTMMGLHQFAPLIVLTGHRSTSINNLYQSALDCGACGGNPGAVNARAAAAIFNDPTVRAALAPRGITIPEDTVFVAALHDTVADTITVLDPHLVPDTHATELAEFIVHARAAADHLVRERATTLPGAHPHQSLARLRARAHDWAEVYPELGLAGNAAMIIGPREMTASVNLHRRVFLHSYRTEMDPGGTGLETILTAPMIVAQWINHQYYFSTLNPDLLSAGTKTIHNAIGGIGVLAGHSGDLRRGLPWQSVAVGDNYLHEPLRLSVIIQAPLERIGDIISGNQVLRDLFDNDWITLTARPSPNTPWHRYTRYGWASQPAHTHSKENRSCTD
ncbi:DUF2309 domain-containing protein [Leucobacter sp. Z1108]|uniref:DUF2309 domain-containing protein n=1 Tax=Leucobacter sp. Z1108 TaxID=3439066 RepID=UPI003F331599